MLAAAWHAGCEWAGAGAAGEEQFIPPLRTAACGARAGVPDLAGELLQAAGAEYKARQRCRLYDGALDPQRDISGTAGHVVLTLAERAHDGAAHPCAGDVPRRHQ